MKARREKLTPSISKAFSLHGEIPFHSCTTTKKEEISIYVCRRVGVRPSLTWESGLGSKVLLTRRGEIILELIQRPVEHSIAPLKKTPKKIKRERKTGCREERKKKKPTKKKKRETKAILTSSRSKGSQLAACAKDQQRKRCVKQKACHVYRKTDRDRPRVQTDRAVVWVDCRYTTIAKPMS